MEPKQNEGSMRSIHNINAYPNAKTPHIVVWRQDSLSKKMTLQTYASYQIPMIVGEIKGDERVSAEHKSKLIKVLEDSFPELLSKDKKIVQKALKEEEHKWSTERNSGGMSWVNRPMSISPISAMPVLTALCFSNGAPDSNDAGQLPQSGTPQKTNNKKTVFKRLSLKKRGTLIILK